ncbi:hypothetical protein OCD85_04695 [Bacillus pacificus]|nr:MULTISPECIES: hypothetical protein [Bacillus]MCU5360341.1 hypothetical protein [Bacillus pacificus]MCU5398656.1 hypothetical protein [Bacillus pacificus]MCX2467063.1 hypothetical protein [Bacillus sp. AM01]MDV8113468.1 hypothetical protein [Bacillus sp. BAU-SS-2023]
MSYLEEYVQNKKQPGAKANGVDFYQYLMKSLTDLPNLTIHRNP